MADFSSDASGQFWTLGADFGFWILNRPPASKIQNRPLVSKIREKLTYVHFNCRTTFESGHDISQSGLRVYLTNV